MESAKPTTIEWMYETLATIFKWVRGGERSYSQLQTLNEVLQCLNDNQICTIVKYSLKDGLTSCDPKILLQAWQILYQKLEIYTQVESIPFVWSQDFLRKQIHNSGLTPIYLTTPRPMEAPGWIFIGKIKVSLVETMMDVRARIAKKHRSGVDFLDVPSLPVFMAWQRSIGRLSEKDRYMLLYRGERSVIISYNQYGFYMIGPEEIPEKALINVFYTVCYSKFESGDDLW